MLEDGGVGRRRGEKGTVRVQYKCDKLRIFYIITLLVL